MMKAIQALALLLVLASAERAFAARAAAAETANDPYSMFVQVATSATLTPSEPGSADIKLTLDGASHLVFVFKDRPE